MRDAPDSFENWSRVQFKLGDQQAALITLFSEKTLKQIEKKFKVVPPKELAIALRETVRFLYVCAYSPHSVFFPGNKLIDDLWHALITETREYREFCDRLRPGRFLDHSGMPFDEYLKNLSTEQIHEEQMSWLVSYANAFGPMDEDAFACLSLAQELCGRIKSDLQGLNTFASELLQVTLFHDQDTQFNYNAFLNDEIAPNAIAIDKSFLALAPYLRRLAVEISSPDSDLVPFTNDHLEALFGVSTALAFTFWQHLAARERLAEMEEWQQRNPNLWSQISYGKLLCGLATTHLAAPGGSSIKAESQEDKFLLSGRAGWVCGYLLFDILLVGFETDKEVVFATIPFPTPVEPSSMKNLEVMRQEMACLNGSSTVEIRFNGYEVPPSSIVSRRAKGPNPATARPSQYVIPEIGIAKNVIQRIETLVETSAHPRHELVKRHLDKLRARVADIRLSKANKLPLEKLIVLRDELNRDAVRCLALALGARAILSESQIPRIQLELLLLDSVVQSPACFDSKLILTSRGHSELA